MRKADTRKVQQRRSFCFVFFLTLSCLQFSISLRFWHGTTQQGFEKHQRGSEFDISLRQHQSKMSGLRLRWDWTQLERHSELAGRMVEHQKNCTLPLANFHYRNRFGLGSDLHVYSVAMCNALEAGSGWITARQTATATLSRQWPATFHLLNCKVLTIKNP